MDALGLLFAFASLTVYPGGLYLLVIAWGVRHGGRLPAAGERTSAAGWLAMLAAAAAVSLAPLPGSPVSSLPPNGGVSPNLVAASILLAAAVGLGTGGGWTRRRLAVAVAVVIAAVMLAVATASLSLTVITAIPGTTLSAARACAAAALLIGAPLLCQPFSRAPVLVRAFLLSSLAVFALALVVSPQRQGWQALAAAIIVAVAAVSYAAIIGLVRRYASRDHVLFVAFSLGAATASAILALGVARP
jgi:hypothetical protein